ncbi:MAG: hypothetical protein WA865_03830 [Spirulinaceae cyanobacterium]
MSKPFKYLLAVLAVIAVGLGLWQVYNIFFANSGGEEEVVGEPPAGEAPAATTEESPAAITEESPAATTEESPATVAPANPPASETPTSETPFRDGVNNATEAANLTQTAQTQQEWQEVATLWQNAIALMKAVPEGDANYQVAQEKVGEYEGYLQYAQQNAGN